MNPDLIRLLAINILDRLEVAQITPEKIYLIENILGSTALFRLVNKKDGFSLAEKACILLLAHGRTRREISEILNIKIKTVAHYHSRIIKKLGCKNILLALLSKNMLQSDLLEQCVRDEEIYQRAFN